MTEQQMRDMKTPWPKSEDELVNFIREMSKEAHTYGKCVYVMSQIATAAFYYASHVVGSTGLQASFADLDIIRRTRGMEHGFRIIDYRNLLYPQYQNSIAGFWQLVDENIDNLSKAASELLESGEKAHPNVLEHWRHLSGMRKNKQVSVDG